MTCGCLSVIDAKLAPDRQLEVAIMLRGSDLIARPYSRILRKDTRKQESRRGQPSLFAFSFCPFCGVRYDPELAQPVEGASK